MGLIYLVKNTEGSWWKWIGEQNDSAIRHKEPKSSGEQVGRHWLFDWFLSIKKHTQRQA